MSGNTQRQQQEPDITWTLPLSQARLVLSQLAKGPYEVVSGLIRFMEDQANSQLQQLEQQMRGNGADRHPPVS